MNYKLGFPKNTETYLELKYKSPGHMMTGACNINEFIFYKKW